MSRKIKCALIQAANAAGPDASIEEIKKAIGEPVSITKKNNFEFWLYEAIVRQGESDKIFKYTQLAISGGVIKNIGNSNRIMSR